MQQADYVNWIECLWTIEGFLGIVLSLIAFVSGEQDRIAIKAARINHGMNIIARTNLQMEVFRLIPHIFVVTIGIWAMTQTPSPLPLTPLQWIFTTMIFSIPICAAINSLNSIYTRHKLMRLTNFQD